jgi:hypothetical protein
LMSALISSLRLVIMAAFLIIAPVPASPSDGRGATRPMVALSVPCRASPGGGGGVYLGLSALVSARSSWAAASTSQGRLLSATHSLSSRSSLDGLIASRTSCEPELTYSGLGLGLGLGLGSGSGLRLIGVRKRLELGLGSGLRLRLGLGVEKGSGDRVGAGVRISASRG